MNYTKLFCLNLLYFLCPLILTAQAKKEITLEDIWGKNTFRQDFVAGFRSLQDGEHYTEITKEGYLVKLGFANGQVVDTITYLRGLVFGKDTLRVDDYEFNVAEDKLLLLTESENIYRRSVLHRVYILDLKSQKISRLHQDKVLHAAFSPDGSKVAYVHNNDMYYSELNNGKHYRISKDGDYNHINGNCDWVYEEEFEFTKAYEWGSESDYIVYYHFDQTEVPEYNFAIYDKLYPTDYKYKYPKAGEKNAIVDIRIYSLADRRSTEVELGNNTDIYIPRIKINPFNNRPIIYKLNRLQNELELLEADVNGGDTKSIYKETNKAYIEINDNVVFLQNRNAMIYTSEKDGYNHIYLHDIDANKSIQLTNGAWDVVEIKGVDEKNNILYYISAESSPLERKLYQIKLDGSQKLCMTPQAGWHQISFSNNYRYYLNRFSSLHSVPVYSLYDVSRQTSRILKNNESLEQKMKEYDLGSIELITIPNEDGVLLNAWIIKPSNFNPSTRYPLLMFQYSGPGSQQVMNQFSGRDFWWYQHLAQKGYIVLCVDGTGTGYRGEAFKKKTYLQLGKYESDDQIAAAKYMAKQAWIDPARIGIWGWSYGGYMSSICLLKGADVFRMAIAVAPVTNWRYYDNIYTERYMRTPAENAKGYDDNSPVNMVQKLKGQYLLIHGTADDNVHYQNAIEMQAALIKANKDFDSEAYPDKNHGISGGVTRLHLYRRMTQFILNHL